MTTKDYIFSESERIYLKGYTDGLKAMIDLEHTCKAENRPSDEGTTTAWMNMPESPNDDYGERFKRNVDESLNELNGKIMRCETDIEMLWDAVSAIRDRLPKEWGK